MMMRTLVLSLGAALALCACATTPLMDERALAADVFRLSGGLEDVRTMARFAAPLALERMGDLGATCRERLGRNPDPLGRLACEMVGDAMKAARVTGAEAARGVDAMIGQLEGRAIDALVETYDARELAAMQRYYSSPEGRAIVAKRGEYLARLLGGN
jgi:hypothetical protein